MAVNRPLCHANSEMLERLLPFHHVEILTSSRAISCQNWQLKIDTPAGMQTVPCDTVVLAIGFQEDNSLYQELQDLVPELYLLGDAKRVANVMYAVWDAYEVANHI